MTPGTLVPSPLLPRRLSLREVQELSEWPYASEPFYVAQVQRSLLSDIPQLLQQRVCVTWGYDDADLPTAERMVGFGVIHISSNYFEVADRKMHFYIPLLSVKPKIASKGYGGSIVAHLIREAEQGVQRANRHQPQLSEYLFLDVYVENERAIECYQKQGFEIINNQSPLLDELENNSPYFVMARALNCR